MGRVELLKKRYIKIIIATTGTARIILSMGDNNEYKSFEIWVNIPDINPKTQPIAKPINILPSVSSSALINGEVKAISNHFLNTVKGPGSISNSRSLFRLTRREAASQIIIQKVATHIAFKNFLKISFLVCFVV